MKVRLPKLEREREPEIPAKAPPDVNTERSGEQAIWRAAQLVSKARRLHACWHVGTNLL